MHLMFEGLIDHVVEVIAFGAIAIVVFAIVSGLLYGLIEEVPGLFDLVAYFWQVYKAEGSPVFFYEMHQGNPVKCKVPSPKIKAFLWKVVALLNQIKIRIFHSLKILRSYI